MASEALDAWRSARAKRLDELLSVHDALGGRGAGRRWRTLQLNRALVVLLAAEFQGFARDLHDAAAETFAEWLTTDPRVRVIIGANITAERALDRGNVHSESLARDFGRFGIDFWSALSLMDARTGTRRDLLRWLNEARNGIAHADGKRLARVEAEGCRICLRMIRRWRSALDGLARSMDRALAAHLAETFGRVRPW